MHFSRIHQDNPLSHRPGKRFGQKCRPACLLCGFCGVKETGMEAVNDFNDIKIRLSSPRYYVALSR